MKRAVLLNDTTFDYHHGCEVVVSKIEQSLKRRNVELIGSCPVGVYFKEEKGFLDLINKSDLVVVNGEGTIHHGREKARWLLEVADYAKSIQRPSVLINCTYNDNPDDFSSLVSNFDKVYVRESHSYNEISSARKDAEIVPDLTMLLSEDYTPSVNSKRKGVVITDSAMIGVSKANYLKSLKKNWTYAPVLRSYRNEGKYSLVESLRHIKFLMSRKKSLDYRNEISDAEYLSVRNSYISTTVKSYLDQLSDAELLLTSRFHSMCFSLVTETPFLATVGNSHKVEGMLSDIGIENRLIDEAFINEDFSIQDYRFDDGELKRVKDYKKQAVEKINKMFDNCCGLIT